LQFKIVCALTNNNGSNGEENKGVSRKESLDVILCDVLHALLGPERARLDPILNLLEPASALLWGFPVALGHGCCRPGRSWVSGAPLESVNKGPTVSWKCSLSLLLLFLCAKLWNEPLNEETIKKQQHFILCSLTFQVRELSFLTMYLKRAFVNINCNLVNICKQIVK
jgi:hypothetical protein